MHKRFQSIFMRWRSVLQVGSLRRDASAALIVTAIAIPESLGYAAIVGLPLQAGLYSALLAPIVFALCASTKRLIIGVDSATTALVAAGAGLIVQSGSAHYGGAVALLTLMVAMILLAIVGLRLDFLADLISRPVVVGFMAGVGVQLIVAKFPETLGLMATHQGILHQISMITEHIGQIQPAAIGIALVTISIMVFLRRSRCPAAFIALGAASIIYASMRFAGVDVTTIGALPAGLPGVSLPLVSINAVVTLFPIALSIALVIVAQSSMVIRNLASEHDEPVQLRQDIWALGLANAASALTHGFVVNGSPPRSVAADLAGSHSRRTGVFMALYIGVLLLCGGWLFAYVPQAALAVIICVIGWHLIQLEELRKIWLVHRAECIVAIVALLGVVFFGVRDGIFIAIIVSLVERLSRQYHPNDEVLLRDGVLSGWAKQRIERHHRHRSSPVGVLAYRFDEALFFENIAYFEERLRQAIRQTHQPVRSVIIDAGAISTMDYTATRAIKQWYRRLSGDDIRLCFAHVPPTLRQQLDLYGITNLIGEANIFETLNDAIMNQNNARRSTVEMVDQLDLVSDYYVVIGGGVMEALGLRSTVDVDLVVSDDVYRYFRDTKHWQEYTQDNGKRILSHDGYNIMRSWMGKNLRALKKHAFLYHEVSFMSVEDLIECKQHLGRAKDLADIKLLQRYLKTHQKQRT